jgi:hypothetical protein
MQMMEGSALLIASFWRDAAVKMLGAWITARLVVEVQNARAALRSACGGRLYAR